MELSINNIIEHLHRMALLISNAFIFQVYQLISRRRFQQMEVLEGQNILVTISGKKNRVRVYYLSWLKSKILRTDGLSDVSMACLIFLLLKNNTCLHSVYFITQYKFNCNLQQVERRNGWINVGDLQGAVHFKIVKYERIKFLVIALKDSIEIYAWAPKPYHKFMAFKVRPSIYPTIKKKLFLISDQYFNMPFF